MSDSPDLTGQQHGRPGRGAGAAAGAAAGAGRDHRGVGQDVRGLLAEKEHEIQKLNRLLEKAGEEVKKWKDHSKSQSKKIQELQSLPSQVTPEQVKYKHYVSTSCDLMYMYMYIPHVISCVYM